MTEKVEDFKPTRKTTRKKVDKPKKSRRLLDLRQYLLNKDIRREMIAAINIEHGTEFHSREEWNEIVSEYKRRQN